MDFYDAIKEAVTEALETGVKRTRLIEFLNGRESVAVQLTLKLTQTSFAVTIQQDPIPGLFQEVIVDPADWVEVLPKLDSQVQGWVDIIRVFSLKSNQVVTGQDINRETGYRHYVWHIDEANKQLAAIQPCLYIKRLDPPAPASHKRLRFEQRRFCIVKLVETSGGADQ